MYLQVRFIYIVISPYNSQAGLNDCTVFHLFPPVKYNVNSQKFVKLLRVKNDTFIFQRLGYFYGKDRFLILNVKLNALKSNS